MTYKIQTPAEIWKDYNAEAESLSAETLFENVEVNRARTVRDYVYTAETRADGEVKVFCRTYVPIVRKGAVILVEDYDARNNQRLIDRLTEEGFAVLIPDYCDRLNCGTKFPPSLAYGKLSNAKNRMFNMIHEAQDTCQILYERILRRAVTLTKNLFQDGKIILAGAGLAAELAVAVTAGDKRVDALALINGGIYREYLTQDRFSDTPPTPMDDHTMSWMSGIASAAYAKAVACPILFLATTNSARFDADRLQTMLQLLKNSDVRTYLTAGGAESVGQDGFGTLKYWLRCVADFSRPVLSPDAKIRYEDGMYSVYVKADAIEKILSVKIFYAFDEYDHRYRNWKEGRAKSISDAGEYLFAVSEEVGKSALFAMAEVRYSCGAVLSSPILFSSERAERDPAPEDRLVMNGADGIKFFRLETDENLITEPIPEERLTPAKIKGVTSEDGWLVTNVLNARRAIDDDAVLQINFFTEKGKMLHIRAVSVSGGTAASFSAMIKVFGASEAFTAVKLSAETLKDAQMISMDSWKTVKSLYIETKGAVIGNILFI